MQSLSTEEFIRRARKKHGARYDYSKVKYVDSHSKVIITCHGHGDFKQTANSHLNGCGCPNCGRVESTNKQRASREAFILKARKKHGGRYDYSKVKYVNARTKVTITCHEHGDFQQTPSSHLQGCGCPKCSFRPSK